MPGKSPMDENIRFLYSCLIRSDFKAIDFNQVGADFGINPPAARMRWARLRRNIAATIPFEDNQISATTPAGKRKVSREYHIRQGKKLKNIVTKEELCSDDEDSVKTETKREFDHISYGGILNRLTINENFGGSRVCLPKGPLAYITSNFGPNGYQEVPIDPQLSRTFAPPRPAFAPIRLTGTVNYNSSIHQSGAASILPAVGAFPGQCETGHTAAVNPTYSGNQDPTQATGDDNHKRQAKPTEPKKECMTRVYHVPETSRAVTNAIPVLVDNPSVCSSVVPGHAHSVLTVPKPSGDPAAVILASNQSLVGVGVGAGVEAGAGSRALISSPEFPSAAAAANTSSSGLCDETTPNTQSHSAIDCYLAVSAAPRARAQRTKSKPKRYGQEYDDPVAAVDGVLGSDIENGHVDGPEDDDEEGGDNDEWIG